MWQLIVALVLPVCLAASSALALFSLTTTKALFLRWSGSDTTAASVSNGSGNLNELERLGCLVRQKEGRHVYFKAGPKLSKKA